MSPRAKKEKKHGFLRITQVRSRIGVPEKVRLVLTRGLGLGRIGKAVVLPDNPYTRGMIAKVPHLVQVEPYEE
ncbi:MAG: 50S ribosomal protein L30 [Thermoanaerobaculum sp.]|nr:50S ribosomal protein L30 [Thermoanaerobaculum sp.]MDW7967830.1 50S ribosomal protein L30 [Thermoanaerobaculum sp.]